MTTNSKGNGVGVDRKLVRAVKVALAEITEDKVHSQAHGRISSKLSRQAFALPESKMVMARCGMCDLVFQQRGGELTPTTINQPKTKGRK